MAAQCRQGGQALVEVVVVAAALVPLLLAIPLLAKYQDLRQAAIAASRSAAFECSVRPDECVAGEGGFQARLADDLRRRHFARHDRDILSNDALEDDPPSSERNRFWVDRRGTPLLAAAPDVTVWVQASELDAARSAWGRGAGTRAVGDAFGMAAAGPAVFGLALDQGLVAAGVQARVSLDRRLADWLERPEGMALRLSGKTAVLVDAWNASSAKGEEGSSFHARLQRGWRLPGLGESAGLLGEAARQAPAGALDVASAAAAEEAIDALYAPIRTLISGPLMAPVEPRGSLFRYHEVDVDVVPADRVAAP